MFKRAALFLVSFILLAALLYNTDYQELIVVASNISFEWVFILVAIQLVIIVLTTLRWYVIIQRYGVSFSNAFQTSLIGLMVNNLTPINYAGGESAKAYIISRIDKVKTEKAFATVFADLFITLLPAIIINIIALILAIKNSFDIRITVVLGFVGVLMFSLFLAASSVVLSKEPSIRLFRSLLNFFAKTKMLRRYVVRIEDQVDDVFLSFHKSIKNTVSSRRVLVSSITLSSLIWILTFFRVYLTFLALGYQIDIETLIVVYAVLLTVSILPLLPGALGIWEWIGAGMFTYFGVPMAVAVAMIILDRLLFYWFPIALGAWASFDLGMDTLNLMKKEIKN
jgi:hypothetical protein